jgi:hypothetical protein
MHGTSSRIHRGARNPPRGEMTRTQTFVLATVAALVSACGMSTPTAPSLTATANTTALTSGAAASAGTLSTSAVSCTIDIAATTRPLPALHVLAAWINASVSSSTLACGQVRSLEAKLLQEVAALDQESQNFAAACGISTGLLAELQALTSTGKLSALTFPAPVPGAPTTVLGLATETNEHFCEAARE